MRDAVWLACGVCACVWCEARTKMGEAREKKEKQRHKPKLVVKKGEGAIG